MYQPTRALPPAQLRFEGQPPYRLNRSDVLWAARAAAFEGDPAEVLWTLSQRYATARQHYRTFGDFVQAFSQPVNPAWRRDGSKCRPGGPFHASVHCSEDRLQRREHASSIGWWGLWRDHPEAAATTLQWASAQLANPVPRATNFAAPSVAQGYLSDHPGATVLLRAGNWFLIEPWSSSWGEDHVTMVGPGRAQAGSRWVVQPSGARLVLENFYYSVLPLG